LLLRHWKLVLVVIYVLVCCGALEAGLTERGARNKGSLKCDDVFFLSDV